MVFFALGWSFPTPVVWLGPILSSIGLTVASGLDKGRIPGLGHRGFGDVVIGQMQAVLGLLIVIRDFVYFRVTLPIRNLAAGI